MPTYLDAQGNPTNNPQAAPPPGRVRLDAQGNPIAGSDNPADAAPKKTRGQLLAEARQVPDEAPDEPWIDPLNPVNTIVTGAYKGAQQTGTNILKAAKGAIHGDFGPYDDPEFQKEYQRVQEPHGFLENVGHFGERVAEFVVGDAAAAKALEAIGLTAKSLPAVIRAGAKVIKGGAVGATITAAQGGDAKTGALLGAGGEAPGAVAEVAAKPVGAFARTLYTRFLNPTKQANKVRALDVVDEALERGVVGSLGKVKETATAGKEAANEALDATYAQHGSINLNTDDITTELEQAKVKYTVSPQGKGSKLIPMSAQDKQAVKMIGGLQKVIEDASTNGQIDIDRLRKIRGAWYRVANGQYETGFAGGSKTLEQTVHSEAAGTIREIINGNLPPDAQIEAINREYTFWKRFEKVAGDSIIRKTGQGIPMGEQLVGAAAAGAGLVSGHGVAGKAASAIIERQLAKLFIRAARSGTITSRSAVLAHALASGRTTQAGAILRGAINAAGSKATQPESDEQ